jgi:hypothetical protein
LLIAKSPGFAPPIVTVEMVRFAVPLLVTVSVCAVLGTPIGWLPKFRLAAEGVNAEAMPVPLSATVCGLPAASSIILIAAMRLPVIEGAKVTLAIQLAPGVSELPHVLLSTKSAAWGPVTTTLAIFRVALPLLVKVSLWGALAVPTGWLLNVIGAPLIVMLAAETGGGVTELPPPPQEVSRRAEMIQTPAKTAGFAQRRGCRLVPIRQDSILSGLTHQGGHCFSLQHADPRSD